MLPFAAGIPFDDAAEELHEMSPSHSLFPDVRPQILEIHLDIIALFGNALRHMIDVPKDAYRVE